MWRLQAITRGIVVLALIGMESRLSGQIADRASKIYADSSKSVLLLVVKSATGELIGQGTGFVTEGGKIITNEHVVRTGNVSIDLGAARIPVTVERVDAFNDLALLVAGAELASKPLIFADDVPSPGASIYTIGNPAGLERSISAGVVSGIRELNGRQLLQISSPISPGSSGGPVFNTAGEVVGVAVGMLEKGQNLNFAVPGALVRKLIKGEILTGVGVLDLLDRVDTLEEKRTESEYSNDSDSDWQKLDRQIDELLQAALDQAGNDGGLLLKIAEKAIFNAPDMAISAAERVERVKSSPESNLLLGRALSYKAVLISRGAKKEALLERAEKALRLAVRTSKQPTAAMYYFLADVLEDRGLTAEAEINFRRALESSKAIGDATTQANSTRGLVRTAHALKKSEEGASWFNALVSSGQATAWDWQSNGSRMDELGRYAEAGQSYEQAGRLGVDWTNWCEAASSYSVVAGKGDLVLASARKCLNEGVGKEDSEQRLALAHGQIADVLNDRGVYQEALSHAREASVLNSSNAWSFDAQSIALAGLRRFQEAINASTQAVRLSDGKYWIMHFNLGAAYFEAENWEFAKQSYEKAAELQPKDSASAYNVALCNARLGYRRDAARWYEEVLRRDPNHRDKQEILAQIQRLRQ